MITRSLCRGLVAGEQNILADSAYRLMRIGGSAGMPKGIDMHHAMGIFVACILTCSCAAMSGPVVLPVHTIAMPEGQAAGSQPDTCLLHLPGIGGRRWTDEQ